MGCFSASPPHSTRALRLEGAEADGGGVDPYRGRVPGAGAHGGLRGVSLLGFISRRSPGYLDNPVRQKLFRAGHAHAGVLIILALRGVSLLGFISRRSPGYLDNRSARTCSGPATPTPAC